MALKTRSAPTLNYYSDNHRNKDGEKLLLPRHTLIHRVTPAHGTWTKDLDNFYKYYLEESHEALDGQPILAPMDGFIFRHLNSLSSRGLGVSLKDYSKWLKINHHTLIESFDRLQDAYLLYRVCRVDTKGQPHDLVLQIPLTPKQGEKHRDAIIGRRKLQATKLERRDMGNEWPGEDRKFSQRRITQAFDGNDKKAEDFTRLVLDVLFAMNTGDAHARKDFERGVIHYAKKQGLQMDEKLFAAAFEIKRRYAPTLF